MATSIILPQKKNLKILFVFLSFIIQFSTSNNNQINPRFFQNKFQGIIELSRNDPQIEFPVDNINEKYNISVNAGKGNKNYKVHIMTTSLSMEITDDSTCLLISDGRDDSKNQYLCGKNAIESLIAENSEYFLLSSGGDWSNASATLVATLYYDVSSCRICDEFCCATNATIWRCVDFKISCDQNGFPCGRHYDDEECRCFQYFGCWSYWNVMWMTSMAVTFFIMVPAIVLFLFLYNRELTRTRLLRPNPDPSVNRGRLGRRRDDDITVHSPPDDLPPTYDDLHGIAEPPPCFCSTVNPGDEKQVTGRENPAFVPEDQTIAKIKCNCANPTAPNEKPNYN